MIGKGSLFVGLVLLLHYGYVNFQYRQYLKLVDGVYTYPPYEVTVGVFAGLAATIFGLVEMSKSFLPIKASHTFHDQTIDSSLTQIPFYSFSHRGKALSRDNEGKKKRS